MWVSSPWEMVPTHRHCGLVRFIRQGWDDIETMLTLGAGHDHPAVGRNIDARDSLVVTFELILHREVRARLAVKLDIDVPRNCKSAVICRERMVCDRVMEKMMDFWAGHYEILTSRQYGRSSSLLPSADYKDEEREVLRVRRRRVLSYAQPNGLFSGDLRRKVFPGLFTSRAFGHDFSFRPLQLSSTDSIDSTNIQQGQYGSLSSGLRSRHSIHQLL